MLASPLKSETASFTNALKQVFYIHKNIVADLKAKLDAVTTAYQELKQSTHLSTRQCNFCTQLDNTTRPHHKESFQTVKDCPEEGVWSLAKGERGISAVGNELTGLNTQHSTVRRNSKEAKATQLHAKQMSEGPVDKSGDVTSIDGHSEPDQTVESQLLLSRDVTEESPDEAIGKRHVEFDVSVSRDKAMKSSLQDSESEEQPVVTDGLNKNGVRSRELRKRPGEKLIEKNQEKHAAVGSSSIAESMDTSQNTKSHVGNSPVAKADGDGVKGYSRLRLTRHGKRKSRYIELESKRQKISTSPLAQDWTSQDGQFRISTVQEDHSSTSHNSTVLVPETEHTLPSKLQQEHGACDDNDDEDSDSIASQQMLVVPETMRMDYLSTSMEEEDLESIAEDTVKGNREPQMALMHKECSSKPELRHKQVADLSNDRSLFEHNSDEDEEEEESTEGTLKAVNQDSPFIGMSKPGKIEDHCDADKLDVAQIQNMESSQTDDLCEGPNHASSSPKELSPLAATASLQASSVEPLTKADNPTDLNSPYDITESRKTKMLPLPNESENDGSDISAGRWITCQKDKSGHDSQAGKLDNYLSRKKLKGSFRSKAFLSEPGRTYSIEAFFCPRGQDENYPSNKSLRQTTLSQAFDVISDRSSNSGSAKAEKYTGSVGKLKEEQQVVEAIRRSLKDIENQPHFQNHPDTGVQESAFKVPISPLKVKSPKVKHQSKSPRRYSSCSKSPGKDESDNSDRKNDLSPLRRSPRLLKLKELSPSSPGDYNLSLSHRDSVDRAKKGLFKDMTAGTSSGSQILPTVTLDGGDHPLTAQSLDPMTMCSLTPVEMKVWNQRENTDSQKSVRSSLRNKGGQPSDGLKHSQIWEANRQIQRDATCDPNGSLNPDVHLSEYLNTEAVSQRDRRQTMQAGHCSSLDALDETVAPNMVSQYIHSVPAPPGSPSFKHRTTPQKHHTVPHKHQTKMPQVHQTLSQRQQMSQKHQNSQYTDSPVNKRDSLEGHIEKMDNTHGEWWNDERGERDETKDADDDSVVFTDGEDEDETVAPSPQQSLQTQCSIPSSSRSFKFVHKHPWQAKSLRHSTGDKSTKDAEFKIPTVDVQVVGCQDGESMAVDQSVDIDALELMDDADEHQYEMENEVVVKQGPQPQSLWDSFDRVPKATEREFPHVQVVRKKSERDKLDGFSCHQCYQYYKNLGLSEESLKQKMKECSRHKERYRPPSTPEHFWSLGFPDTAEISERKQGKCPSDSPVTTERAPRRRKRLEKKF